MGTGGVGGAGAPSCVRAGGCWHYRTMSHAMSPVLLFPWGPCLGAWHPQPRRDMCAALSHPHQPWGHWGNPAPMYCACAHSQVGANGIRRATLLCHPAVSPGHGHTPHPSPCIPVAPQAVAGQDVSPSRCLTACWGRGAVDTPAGVSDGPCWSHYISFSLALSVDMRDRRGFSRRSQCVAALPDGWRGWEGAAILLVGGQW